MKQKVALSVTEYKDEVMSNLTWMKKERRRNTSTSFDITISLVANKKNEARKIIQFIFRNGVETKISKTGYMLVGTYKNRCFFRQATKEEGYKISGTNVSRNKYVRVSTYNDIIQFIGDYELQYDDFLEMYYVDKEVKN